MDATTALTRVRRRVADTDKLQIDDATAIDLLNEALHEISTRSESIVYGMYHPCVTGEGQYGLADEFLAVKFCEFNNSGDKYFLTASGVKRNTYLINNEIGSLPLYYTVAGQSSLEKVVAPVTRVVNSLSFNISNQPSNIKVGDIVINTSNADASATITALDTEITVDKWEGQDDVIEKGDTIAVTSADGNTNRGSVTIVKVEQHGGIEVNSYLSGLAVGDKLTVAARKLSTTLRGWTTSSSEAGKPYLYTEEWGGVQFNDLIRILSPDRANKTLLISPAPSFTDKPGDESIFVFGAYRHREITQSHITNRNDELELDDELLPAFYNLLAMKFSEIINSVEDPMTDKYESGYHTKYSEVIGGITDKIREYQTMWASGALTPVKQTLAGITDPVGHPYNKVTIV